MARAGADAKIFKQLQRYIVDANSSYKSGQYLLCCFKMLRPLWYPENSTGCDLLGTGP
jgi:hypothetical protein